MSGWQGEQCSWMQTRPGDPQPATSSWGANMGLQRAAAACSLLAMQAERFIAIHFLSSHSMSQHPTACRPGPRSITAMVFAACCCCCCRLVWVLQNGALLVFSICWVAVVDYLVFMFTCSWGTGNNHLKWTTMGETQSSCRRMPKGGPVCRVPT